MSLEHEEEMPDFLPTDFDERDQQIEFTNPIYIALAHSLAVIEGEDVVSSIARSNALGRSVESDELDGVMWLRTDYMGERIISVDVEVPFEDLFFFSGVPDVSMLPPIPPVVLNSEFADLMMERANRLGITVEEAFDRLFTFGLKMGYELRAEPRVVYRAIATDGTTNRITGFGFDNNLKEAYFRASE